MIASSNTENCETASPRSSIGAYLPMLNLPQACKEPYLTYLRVILYSLPFWPVQKMIQDKCMLHISNLYNLLQDSKKSENFVELIVQDVLLKKFNYQALWFFVYTRKFRYQNPLWHSYWYTITSGNIFLKRLQQILWDKLRSFTTSV